MARVTINFDPAHYDEIQGTMRNLNIKPPYSMRFDGPGQLSANIPEKAVDGILNRLLDDYDDTLTGFTIIRALNALGLQNASNERLLNKLYISISEL